MRTLLHPASKTPALTDLALLISRVALGVVLIAHGWQKFNEWTLDGTAAAFADMGIPAASVAATFTTFVEMIGGAALILGAFTPVVALLNIVNLLGALTLVHAANGVFVGDNGYELVLALAAGDSGRFQAVPGIGKRTAERIVVELRDKVDDEPIRITRSDDPRALAREGLVELGFAAAEAEKLLAAAQGDSVEELIGAALRGARP